MKKIYRHYKTITAKVNRGLRFKVLDLLKEQENLSIDETLNHLSTSLFNMRVCFRYLLKHDFVIRINKQYYLSPNVLMVTTESPSIFPAVKSNGNRADRLSKKEKLLIYDKLNDDLKNRKQILTELKGTAITKDQIIRYIDKMVDSGKILKINDLTDMRKVGYRRNPRHEALINGGYSV